MFQFLKPKSAPEGPIELRFDVTIERPAEEVYALVDWGGPRNAKRELGNEVVAVEGRVGQFHLALAGLPGQRFEITVFDAVPHAAYSFECDIVPMIGQLKRTREVYAFEPVAEGVCLVTLAITATFASGLSARKIEHERLAMTAACVSALAKLKIHAEKGVEAVRVVESQQLV